MTAGVHAHADPNAAPDDDAIPGYVRELEQAAQYLPADQRMQLRRAWAVGAAAHEGQTRKSGEPYITHPVAVAKVLAEQRVDVETLVAAILHDTIEDTPLTRQQLADEFGETVPNWSMVTVGQAEPSSRQGPRRKASAKMLAMSATCA